jgi:hypothetical protein
MNRGSSLGGIPRSSVFAKQIPKESIPHIPRRRLHTDMLFRRALRDIIAVDIKSQIMLMSQTGDEVLVQVGFGPAQLVIEMDSRENQADFVPQLEQETQERDRINSAGNANAHAIPSPQQRVASNVGESALRQGMHADMVQQRYGTAGLMRG